MNRAGGQQARHGGTVAVGLPVAEHQDVVPTADHRLRLGFDVLYRGIQASDLPVSREDCIDHAGPKVAVVQFPQLGHLIVGQDRRIQVEVGGILGGRLHDVAGTAQHSVKGHDAALPYRIDRRIGHLGEKLLEVVGDVLGLQGQHRQRRIAPHRSNGVFSGLNHRFKHDAKVLLGVAEKLEPTE